MRKYFSLTAAIGSTILLTAQVHVRDEPRHHNVFENEFVRILDVHLSPGDTTLYHLHNTPSVFIIFTNVKVGSQLVNQQPQHGANVSGEVSYDNIHTPRTHRVWNDDTSWFHVMDIELTNTKEKLNVPLLRDVALKLLFNEQQVNGYNLELKRPANVDLPSSPGGYLLISKSEAVIEFKLNNTVHNRIIKPSHYIWIEAGKNFSVKLVGNQTADFVVLQLK